MILSLSESLFCQTSFKIRARRQARLHTGNQTDHPMTNYEPMQGWFKVLLKAHAFSACVSKYTRKDIGSSIQKVSQKGKKRWRWPCKRLKLENIYNHNIVIPFAMNWFQICLFIEGPACLMSNYHDFDEDQISWKLAQR